jgi:hypothetical protein
MPKTQSFNSNSEIYADCWKISGLDLQVAHKREYIPDIENGRKEKIGIGQIKITSDYHK